MEGTISFWGYKEQESNLILPEHDDDDITLFCHFHGNLWGTKQTFRITSPYNLYVRISHTHTN
jgi:hypothetical protein